MNFTNTEFSHSRTSFNFYMFSYCSFYFFVHCSIFHYFWPFSLSDKKNKKDCLYVLDHIKKTNIRLLLCGRSHILYGYIIHKIRQLDNYWKLKSPVKTLFHLFVKSFKVFQVIVYIFWVTLPIKKWACTIVSFCVIETLDELKTCTFSDIQKRPCITQ